MINMKMLCFSFLFFGRVMCRAVQPVLEQLSVCVWPPKGDGVIDDCHGQ